MRIKEDVDKDGRGDLSDPLPLPDLDLKEY
jgi:hypothetical protein